MHFNSLQFYLLFQTLPTHTIEKSYFSFPGAFVPVTTEGNIIVDGVLASCYPSTDHNLAHFAMTPIQWFPETKHWMFSEGNGFPVYVQITEELGNWILSEKQTMGYYFKI